MKPNRNKYMCVCVCVCVCVYIYITELLCIPKTKQHCKSTIMCVCSVQLFATPWTTDHQVLQSMEFFRQQYQCVVPFPPPGDLLDPGIESMSPLPPVLRPLEANTSSWMMEKPTTGKTITLTRRTFVGKVMSLLFNTLSRLVITFLSKGKCLLISWLQSPSAVILEPKWIKSVTVSIVSPSICHEVMGPDAMILVFWMLSFKPSF